MTKENEGDLAHYGVPGMKWGKRKAAGSGSEGSTRKERKAAKRAERDKNDSDIINARLRQEKRVADLNVKAAKTYSETTKKGLEAATKAWERAEKRLMTNPDAATAARMTSGEKSYSAVMLTIGGLAAAAALGGAAMDYARR